MLKAEECQLFNSEEENVSVNAPKNEKELLLNDTQKVEEVCVVSPHRELRLLKGNKRDVGCETFSALFDDDADEYMLRCSQEVEENLNKNVTVVGSGNSRLPLPEYKNSDFFPVESKIKGTNICRSDRNSSFHVKLNSSSSKKPNSPKVGTKYYVRIKSGTPKHLKNERCHSRSERDHSGVALHCHSRSHTETTVTPSKPSSTNEIAFDDSFDAVIQNLTEEDIEMLSQGHIVDRRDSGNITDTGTAKPTLQAVNCKRGSIQKFATGQFSPARRLKSNGRPVNRINSDRQSAHTDQGSALREVCAPRNNKMQFRLKVPSQVCTSRRFSDLPCAVSSVQLNESHFKKDVPLVSDNVFVTRQRPSNSAPAKSSDIVRPSSSTSSNSLACKYYVRIRSRRLECSRCENCACGFSVNCLSASVRKCHGHPYLCSKHSMDQRRSRSAVKDPCSILDAL